MMLQPLDDASGRFVLFPAWDGSSWDGSFKLRGPRNTVVEAECTGGQVTGLTVSPASRAGDVLVDGCGGGMRTAQAVMAELA